MTMTTPICDLIDVTKHYVNHVVLDRFTVQIEPQGMVSPLSDRAEPLCQCSSSVLASSL